MNNQSEIIKALAHSTRFMHNLQVFKVLLDSARRDGFTSRGYPLVITSTHADGRPDRIITQEQHPENFSGVLPVFLHQSGYRIEQFGSLFVAQGRLGSADGEVFISAMLDTIRGVLARHSDPQIRQQRMSGRTLESAFIHFLSTLMLPSHVA